MAARETIFHPTGLPLGWRQGGRWATLQVTGETGRKMLRMAGSGEKMELIRKIKILQNKLLATMRAGFWHPAVSVAQSRENGPTGGGGV
jgi:hypothetical protein